MNETNRLPQPDRDRPLIEAFHDLAERLRPGGPYGEIDEWSIYDESLRRLVRWSEETGCFFENLQPLKEGGREHDLTFVEEGAFWLKFTKPFSAGYVVSFASGLAGWVVDGRTMPGRASGESRHRVARRRGAEHSQGGGGGESEVSRAEREPREGGLADF